MEEKLREGREGGGAKVEVGQMKLEMKKVVDLGEDRVKIELLPCLLEIP